MHVVNDQNEKATFDDLFREYFKPLCIYCQLKFGLDIDTAMDAVHSGFLNFLESDKEFSSNLSARAYLYKIVTNICIDLGRHEKIKQQHLNFIQKNASQTGLEKDHIVAEFKELQNDINKAIEELPDQMREVFELSRNEKLRYAEIAHQLGISIKTVETQMSRALVKLRQKLSAYLSS